MTAPIKARLEIVPRWIIAVKKPMQAHNEHDFLQDSKEKRVHF